jgi:sn-glycerol 3-phosphate transport system permease protein
VHSTPWSTALGLGFEDPRPSGHLPSVRWSLRTAPADARLPKPAQRPDRAPDRSATATFLFRQFFLTAPDELTEAARIDGAGAMKFFKDILLPLSRTNIAALFVILFIYGWNQYLWPLLITTDESMCTIVMGIQRMVTLADAEPLRNLTMAVAMLALLPPVVVVLVTQRWFVKGLIETDK